MRSSLLTCALILLALPRPGWSHAAPTLVPVGPLHVQGNRLVDSARQEFLLRGARMGGLQIAQPSETERRTVDAMNAFTFRVMRLRWNLNALRLPVSTSLWRRDGDVYLRKVAAIVRAANKEDLVVILAAVEDPSAGLPSPAGVAFWRTWAAFFKDSPSLIFDVFHQPSAANVPGHAANRHSASDWRFWRDSMQAAVDAIRSTGATQIIAVQSFHDSLDFQGFGPEFYIRDPNILMEVHPYYDHALTDAERLANFGFVGAAFPLYAGEWGLTFSGNQPACAAIPRGPDKAAELLYQSLAYFDLRNVSWTATAFEPGQLILDVSSFVATVLDRPWDCALPSDPPQGMGQMLLLWMTGDQAGFGTISADQMASAAGGFSGPVAPGGLISIYGQGVGPETTVTGQSLTLLGGTQVLFDGVPAPLFSAGAFQVIAQVPYELAGNPSTMVQVFYREVPSNKVVVQVVDTAPEIFALPGTPYINAVNEDGTRNSTSRPAAAGSIVTFYATGGGVTSPASATGLPAPEPYARLLSPVSLFLGGQAAELLYAGPAPGQVGMLQVNVRVPSMLPDAGVRQASVRLLIGNRSSRLGLTVWVE